MSSKPLQQKAYEYIQSKIKNGDFSPGVIYSETKLAAEIGISRTPFKDALSRLNQDRFIDIIPSKGFRLHLMTLEDILNTFQVRLAIEGFCAISLNSIKDEPDGKEAIRRLYDCIDKMEQCISAGSSIEDYLVNDFMFHRIIVESSKNLELIELIESYSHRQHDIAYKSLETLGRLEQATDEHKAILNSILCESPDAIQEIYTAVQIHMMRNRYIAAEKFKNLTY